MLRSFSLFSFVTMDNSAKPAAASVAVCASNNNRLDVSCTNPCNHGLYIVQGDLIRWKGGSHPYGVVLDKNNDTVFLLTDQGRIYPHPRSNFGEYFELVADSKKDLKNPVKLCIDLVVSQIKA